MKDLNSFESFMNLDVKGCEMASRGLMRNAKAKFQDAELLAKNESWGSASSIMITSMEESIKSMILAFDSVGFKFRNNVNGIKSIFNQHGLRYQFAFLLSGVNVFSSDIKTIHLKIKNREDLSVLILELDVIIRILKLKIHSIKKEIEWFEKIGFHRERGLYYDIRSGVIDPTNFKKIDYKMISQRVKGIISIVDYIYTIIEDAASRDNIMKLQQQFLTEKWYDRINDLAKKVNKNKGPIFETVREFILDYEEMLDDDESIAWMKSNLDKLKNNFIE